MKHIFIINPAAGKGKAGKVFLPKILETVKKLGIEYELHRTMGTGDATNFVRGRCEASKNQGQQGETLRFYACGGDGTLNEVANGAFGYDNVEIAMIPTGTGNDFVRNFSDSKGFLDVERQINGKAISIDLIKYEETKREEVKSGIVAEDESAMAKNNNTSYGINMFNIGLDSSVAVKAAEYKKYFMISGSMAYGLGVGVVLISKEIVNLDIEFDDRKKYTGNIALIAIANGCYCGGGFKAVPHAKLDDGLMDVSIVQDVNRRTLISILAKYKKGTHLEDKKHKEIFTYKKCKSLTITPKLDLKLCTDGEISQTGKLRFEIMPNAMKFSLPQGCE